MREKEPILLLVTIVDRGRGSQTCRFYSQHQLPAHLRCEGTGSATSEILDILGIGSSEKDILFSFAPRSAVQQLLPLLREERSLGRGIAFTVPLVGISRLLAVVLHSLSKPEKETEETTMSDHKQRLIVLSVNQGFADAVMLTARRAGARGGTILRGRWSGAEALGEVFESARTAEKEIIAIVAPTEKADGIMQQVTKEHGLDHPAGAVVCAVDIGQTVHLG